MQDVVLHVGVLYPDQMPINGDYGNLTTVVNRCRWRNIETQTTDLSSGVSFDAETFDLMLFGGGEDWAIRATVAEDLQQTRARVLRETAIREVVIFATGGAYPLCGRYLETPEGKRIPGVGLLDVWTRESDAPMVGSIVVECGWLSPGVMTGIERHSGKTYLGRTATPLGRRILGHGNNGEDPTEGCRNRNVFGTNLQGPVLAYNPHLADYLVQLALQRRYAGYTLSRLDDAAEWRLHRQVTEGAR
ncbi:MAG: glutamine amidotransferase [candidate division Zixibacteria bacterium]|nr:glutamine amidotransferase [candidate division Zixibacteria bacterium]